MGKKKPGTAKKARAGLLARVRNLALPLAKGGVSVLMGLAAGIMLMIPNIQAFGIIFAVGWILIAVRIMFMWMVPTLCKISGVLTVCINMIMIAVALIVDIIVAAIFVVEEIVYALKAGHGHRPTLGKFMGPPELDDHEVKSFLQEIASTCGAYDSFQSIWGFVVKSVASPTVCPVIRATFALQPKRGINWYAITDGALGWLSHNAEPYPGNNCEDNSEAPEWVCVGLGTGYIVLELLLPILIGGIFVYTMSGGIFYLLYRTFAALFTLGKLAVTTVFKALEKL